MKLLLTLIIGCFSCFAAQAAPPQEIPTQQTLSIIKPEVVASNQIGAVITRFEKAGLSMVAAKMTRLTEKQAEKFYETLKDRPFYRDLVTYMSSGPVFVQVLEGPNAIKLNRDLMGDTDPKKAKSGTIRAY